MRNFDAIIIGAGQAGGPLSHKLADKGWKTALIEREFLGGSCINFACTPTKTMVASARVAYIARSAEKYGVKVSDVNVDLAKVVQRKNEIVQNWRKSQQDQVKKRDNLTLLRASARFIDKNTIKVGDQEIISPKIFINTGTNPRVLPIDGLDKINYLTNRNIMDLTSLPDHLVIIGGSYVGLEFGQMFRRFGSEVTIVEFNSKIIPKEDEDIANTLQKALEDEGIKFVLHGKTTKVDKLDKQHFRLTIEDTKDGSESIIEGSHLLLAVGRVPNTSELQPEVAGIEMDDTGFIKVNRFLETNVEGIYALGDVKGGPMFTHISYNDFQIVYHNLFNQEKMSLNERLVPYALFTDPELGRVGMTEREARDENKKIKVGSVPMKYVARAVERGRTKGLMKVIIDSENDRLIGAAILGIEGGELIQNLVTLMRTNAPWTIMKGAIYIHPTLTEGFFSLMDQV